MSQFARAVLGAATFCTVALMVPVSSQALPNGMKSMPGGHGAILVKRECIAYERDENGVMKCVRWADCGDDVC
jgi:hypothetical protein